MSVCPCKSLHNRTIDLPGIKKLRSGKVREVFDLGETLLFVATDRISAFDVILPDPIPNKGAVLNQISAFWFNRFGDDHESLRHGGFRRSSQTNLQPFREQLAGRSMIVKKTKPLPVECVVRGYLAGSGWKEYQESQSICGIKLPAGLKQASQLPEPIFTPATKAEEGHDENIDMKRCAQILGEELADRVKDAKPGNLFARPRLRRSARESSSRIRNLNSALSMEICS